MKKYVAILLLVIVALTAFTPCCTYDNCAQEQAEAGHSDNRAKEGVCSPFSSCTTCFGFTIQVHNVQVPVPRLHAPKHRRVEIASSLPSISFSFWQPPRPVA